MENRDQTMRRASAIHDPVASGSTRCCRLRHLQFKTWREGQFLRGASAHALRWQAEQSATPDHVSLATSKVGFREEKMMAWPARLGVSHIIERVVGKTKVPQFCVLSARSNATRACASWLHTVGWFTACGKRGQGKLMMRL
jgi:hypothetical protein